MKIKIRIKLIFIFIPFVVLLLVEKGAEIMKELTSKASNALYDWVWRN
jgi:hypothetical protein